MPEKRVQSAQASAAGALSGAPAPTLVKAGYPGYAGRFYHATHWQDSMASGALANRAASPV